MKTRFHNPKSKRRIRVQICWHCNANYVTSQPFARYCSEDCKTKSRRAEANKRKRAQRRYDAKRNQTPKRKKANRLRQAERRNK
jgi:hypothetical protein